MSQIILDYYFLMKDLEILAPTEYMETSSQLFGQIHSIFDARKEDKLDEATTSPYNTRSSSSHPHLNLEDNWSDSIPAFVDSSRSARDSNNNPGELTIPGKVP
jgi:hypothetical protein